MRNQNSNFVQESFSFHRKRKRNYKIKDKTHIGVIWISVLFYLDVLSCLLMFLFVFWFPSANILRFVHYLVYLLKLNMFYYFFLSKLKSLEQKQRMLVLCTCMWVCFKLFSVLEKFPGRTGLMTRQNRVNEHVDQH